MTEILVHANLGHEGVCLIAPVWNLDNRCMYPRAISLMTTRPLQEEVNGPITEKQSRRNKKGRRYATYAVYNTSHETIILPKNQIVGRCQLILQPNEGAYLQEMSAMHRECCWASTRCHATSRFGSLQVCIRCTKSFVPTFIDRLAFPLWTMFTTLRRPRSVWLKPSTLPFGALLRVCRRLVLLVFRASSSAGLRVKCLVAAEW